MSAPGMKELNEYTNRATYLMSLGRPGARIAMYYPTSSMWLGNNTVYNDLVVLTQEMLKHQRDFDYLDDDAFGEALVVGPGYLENKSGQRYYTLIIPSADAISASAWRKIEEFEKGGGKVLFWGRRPTMLVDKTFVEPQSVPDMPDAYYEPSLEWTYKVSGAMPEAEMSIYKPERKTSRRQKQPIEEKPFAVDSVRYTRRVMSDGDLYFIFNEGDGEVTFTACFDKVGAAKEWNANDGSIKEIPFKEVGGKTELTLTLAPWESKIVTFTY